MKKPSHGGKRTGSGRPPTGRSSITFRLLDASIEKLVELAPTRLEQSALVDELLEKHHAKQNPKKISGIT